MPTPITYMATIFDCPPFLMFHNHDCVRYKDIMEHGRFEPASMKLWCHLARTATCIVDAGAQVGVYSLAAASLRKELKIHAFEPNPDAFARLQIHVRMNEFPNVMCYRQGLAADNGIAPLSWKERGWISSGARLGEFLGETTVPVHVARLDSLRINLGPKGLIKIDVEGLEAAVIEGMGEMLQSRPDMIVECFSPENCFTINTILPDGYRAYRIIESTGELIETKMLEPADPKGEDFNSFLTVRECPKL